jgi:hypothetical protein
MPCAETVTGPGLRVATGAGDACGLADWEGRPQARLTVANTARSKLTWAFFMTLLWVMMFESPDVWYVN